MILDRIILLIVFLLLELAIVFATTVFYINARQNRKHEKELLERQLQTTETENSIKENDQIKELLNMIKDFNL